VGTQLVRKEQVLEIARLLLLRLLRKLALLALLAKLALEKGNKIL
jgi:hypothetical protein